jgi:hypothetical protein
MTDFFRFPHTPHLAWLGQGIPRDDKVLSRAEAQALLLGEVVVEEKLDGANLGISLAPDGGLRAQNRGQYLGAPFAGQFSRLPAWLAMHESGLRAVLQPALILFGEWCAARHSVSYDRLPDLWLLFDVYDREAGGSGARRGAMRWPRRPACVASLAWRADASGSINSNGWSPPSAAVMRMARSKAWWCATTRAHGAVRGASSCVPNSPRRSTTTGAAGGSSGTAA